MAVSLCILCCGSSVLKGLHKNTGVHDPTGIQKDADTYWIFGTGNGIHAKFSRDLISWTEGQSPFTGEIYPAWINTYVPGFEGLFWAPDCKFMNGKYYLYYSCSTWGSKVSCIGLATNKTLDPKDPEYAWNDQGVVVFSDQNSEANCIDPAIFRDTDGAYYMSYGSYFGGIRILALDSVSGKPADGTLYPVASGNCEASYVIPKDGFYYLFINRGSCCQGVNSTYHIQVGRSESPTGPFLDMGGTDLNEGGGSTIHSTNGHFIGPGHIGYYVEEGVEWVTYHYYDGDRNGSPTLAIATMQWDLEGWPDISNEFLDKGEYLLVNRNSQLVLQTVDPVAGGNPVTQGSYMHLPEQKWYLDPIGNGYYRILQTATDFLAEPEGCSATSGISLVMGADNYMPCETWKFERTNELEYVISSRAGNNVLNVPAPAFEEGTQIVTAIFSGIASHYWQVRDTSVSLVAGPFWNTGSDWITLYPNPSGGMPVHLRIDQRAGTPLSIEVIRPDGAVLYRDSGPIRSDYSLLNNFTAGLYYIRIRTEKGRYQNKFLIF